MRWIRAARISVAETPLEDTIVDIAPLAAGTVLYDVYLRVLETFEGGSTIAFGLNLNHGNGQGTGEWPVWFGTNVPNRPLKIPIDHPDDGNGVISGEPEGWFYKTVVAAATGNYNWHFVPAVILQPNWLQAHVFSIDDGTTGLVEVWILVQEPATAGPLYDSIDDTLPLPVDDDWSITQDISAFTVVPSDPDLNDPEVEGDKGSRTAWGQIDRREAEFAYTFRAEVDPAFFRIYLWQGAELTPVGQSDATGAIQATLPAGEVYYLEVVTVEEASSVTTVTITGTQAAPETKHEPSRLKLAVNMVDIIDHVGIAQTWFESRSDGNVGTCEIWLRDDRDPEHPLPTIKTGARIVLRIDDQDSWQGYVSAIDRRYIFPVQRIDEPTETVRWIVVLGADVNVLFQKRYVYNKARPEWGPTPMPKGTTDVQALADLHANFLDLTGDDLDVSSKVVQVGSIAEDHAALPFEVSMSWGEAVTEIARTTGALYYINPDRELVYAKTDVVTAPYAVSDTPDGVTTFGYREFQLLRDATALANDALVWGTGKGSRDAHFGRYDESQSNLEAGNGIHWQWPDHRDHLWVDATLEKRARSYVLGSNDPVVITRTPRGHGKEAISAEFVMFKAGLQVGHVLRVISSQFDFDEEIPIRGIRISAVGGSVVGDDDIRRYFMRYDLRVAHFYDAPYTSGLIDPPTPFRPEQNCQFIPHGGPCLDDYFTTVILEDEEPATFSGTGYVYNDENWLAPRRSIPIGGPPWCILLESSYSFRAGDSTYPLVQNDHQMGADQLFVTYDRNNAHLSLNYHGESTRRGALLGLPNFGRYFMRILYKQDEVHVKIWMSDTEEPEAWTLSRYRGMTHVVYGPFNSDGPWEEVDRLLPNAGMHYAGQLSLWFAGDTPVPPHWIAVSAPASGGWGEVKGYLRDPYSFQTSRKYEITLEESLNWAWPAWKAAYMEYGIITFAEDGNTPVSWNIYSHENMPPSFLPEQAASTEVLALDSQWNKLVERHHSFPSWWSSPMVDDAGLQWAEPPEVRGTQRGRIIEDVNRFYTLFVPWGVTSARVIGRVRADKRMHPTDYLGTPPDTGPPLTFSITTSKKLAGEYAFGPSTPQWMGTLPLYGAGQEMDVSFLLETFGTTSGDVNLPPMGEFIQLGAEIIAPTESDWADAYGQYGGPLFGGPGWQIFAGFVEEPRVRYTWQPLLSRGDGRTMYTEEAVNCAPEGQFCEAPHWKSGSLYQTLRSYVTDSLQVWFDQKRMTNTVDYEETDPSGATFTFLKEAGDLGDRISICYHIRDLSPFEQPKGDPKFNWHPGYGVPDDSTGPVHQPPDGYHPQFRSQLGWGTSFDSLNCTCASTAMWIDAVTGGDIQPTPPEIRERNPDQVGGTSVADMVVAASTYGITMVNHGDSSWGAVGDALDRGPIILSGVYGEIPKKWRKSRTFLGGHTMFVLCWSQKKTLMLLYDPLHFQAYWIPQSILHSYAAAFENGITFGALP